MYYWLPFLIYKKIPPKCSFNQGIFFIVSYIFILMILSTNQGKYEEKRRS